jgi:putative endonuclease
MTERRLNRKKGREYEKLAEKYLVENGFSILERNWTVGHKEIDLIALKDNTVVFVEVKGGSSKQYGHPSERVDKRKRENLINAAEQFILANNFSGYDFRFDIITFYDGKLEHYPDAFQCEE